MKIASVQFINPVAHGGGIKSASSTSASNPERAGSTPFEIEFDPESNLFKVTRTVQGKVVSKFVPMSNVSGFEMADEPKAEVKPAAGSKEVKK